MVKPKRQTIAAISIAIIFVVGIILYFYNIYSSIMDQSFNRKAEATKTVEAIYKYKYEIGLWPMQIDDLIPEYLDPADKPPAHWEYIWSGYDEKYNHELRTRGALHTHIFYKFPKAKSTHDVGWHTEMEGDPVSMDTRQSIPQIGNASVEELSLRTEAELNRRIQTASGEREKMLHEKELMKLKSVLNAE